MRYKAIPELDYQKKVQLLFPEIIDKKAIRQITFQVTEDCCLACTYCYQINKSKNKMSFETAKEFLDNLFEQKYPEINKENTLEIQNVAGISIYPKEYFCPVDFSTMKINITENF